MGDVINVDFKVKKKPAGTLTEEELEEMFLNAMRDADSPPFDKPEDYDEE